MFERDFSKGYMGEFESEEVFAEDFYNAVYGIPSFLKGHIDWESVAFDLKASGEFVFIESACGVDVYKGDE